MKKTYQIGGMSCSACASAVERILKRMDGVTSAQVNLVLEEVVVEGEDLPAFADMQKAVEKGGYQLLEKSDAQMQTWTVKGMSCAACSASVERILKRFDEVEDASVNLIMNNVTITYHEKNFKAWKEALEKAGFILEEENEEEQVVLDIEGMSCAACSASIERVLRKKDGILQADVNLVMNQAEVRYDKKRIKLSEILEAIQKAGFKGHLHVEKTIEKEKRSYEKLHVYGTLVLAFFLLYIGMSHMLGSIELPLPNIISYKTHPFNFAGIQFVLATIILISGHHFFTRGIKALLHKAPNMDTLVAIGTGSAYLYSLVSLMQIYQGNVHAVHALYFEGAGVVVALVQFGKHLESISKKKSTGAIQALLQLRPQTATLWREGKEILIQIEEVSVGDGCVQAECALIGGETAEMPDMYDVKHYDIAGFCVGAVDKCNLLDGQKIEKGNVLIGLPSSGVHSNGFSLIRKVLLKDAKLDLHKSYEELGNEKLGDVLLTPTKIYVKAIKHLLGKVDIKGMSHITGGGFYENVPRMLKEGQGVSIDLTTYPHKPIFDFIAKTGDIPMKEMCNVFNMGIGFMMAVDKADVEKVQSLLKEIGEESYVIGEVTDSGSVDLTW